VALGGLVLVGCTEYRPVHWGGAVPWEQARRSIYEDGGARQVPDNARHVVMPGETVSELAVMYRVRMADLVALNNIAPPHHIYVGQVLRLPTPAAPSPSPGDGLTHVVARGDTLSAIAATYGVKLGDVLALNRQVDPARLHVGTAVRLPAAATTQLAQAPPPRPVAARPTPASPMQARPAAAPAATATVLAPSAPVRPAPAARVDAGGGAAGTTVQELPPPDVERDAARQRDLAAVQAPPLSGQGFLWPVDSGAVISGFGGKPDGRRNDGINIAAPAGSIVRAAENGLVVYADEDLAAFGRMLLVRHAGGYLTAYAHNDALLVTRGDVVARGQPIAKVGRSGDVVEPQLHFEIRQGKSAIDPVALLGDSEVRVAQRD
jgi:murein DD-endopeptidase MepM/ murein hydrolase activator NlpD